jgi:hypothetical protein
MLFANQVNEFYKKGCQEKKAPLRPEAEIVSRDPAHCSFVSLKKWFAVHSRKLPCGHRVRKSGKRRLGFLSTMVLSEARGLSLFLVLRGGIACNG